jgi:small subunit ribosomal protein S8
MAISDPIADMLTRIRNANMVGHQSVELPASNIKVKIARILEEEGFVAGVGLENEGTKDATINLDLQYWGKSDPVITGIKRISKPGLRVYVGKDELPYVYGGRGIAVISTNEGVMSASQAKNNGVGGEVLFYVW